MGKNNKLTVLQVATIDKPITPTLGYSPIETVIQNIDGGLVSLGHKSIVACSSDSKVVGEKYPTVRRSLGGYFRERTPEQRKKMRTHLSRALERAKKPDIDIIHTHNATTAAYFHNNRRSDVSVPIVMTLHIPSKVSYIKESNLLERINGVVNHNKATPSLHFVPISKYQKRQYYGLVNTTKAIHHGINVNEYPYKTKPSKEGYFFCIGRIAPVKGQDKALEFAKKTGFKLIIAGPIQDKPADKEFFEALKGSIDLIVDISKQPVKKNYYNKVIKPLLECDKKIIYIGELNTEQKKQWYRYARATLFPIRWEEPFGLVLIESMACGTPVLAFRGGAVPEIVVAGKTGFVVDSLDDMIKSARYLNRINPLECRKHVQNGFSMIHMASQYSELYYQIINGRR